MNVERRQTPLSDQQIEDLAEILAPKLAPLVRAELQENFYNSVGKTVTEKFFILVGLITIALASYLSAKGIIKWP